MVHTAIPYASFASACSRANSEGGLWDIRDDGGPPGYFLDSVTGLSVECSAFTGIVYGDVNVNTIGEPGAMLNFVWSFGACAEIDDGTVINTSVGNSTFPDTLPSCTSNRFLTAQHTGTVQVNVDETVRIILSSTYHGQGSSNVNVYIGAFKFQLALAPLSSSSPIAGTSIPSGENDATTVTESTVQHSSESSGIAVMLANNTSPLPSTTGSRLSPITTSGTRPQSYSNTAFSPFTSINSTNTPRYGEAPPNHSQIAPIVGGALVGLILLSLIVFITWRYRRVWRKWKVLRRRRSSVHLEPFFVNAGGDGIIGSVNGDERTETNATGRNGGWGRNGLRVMDGYGLEIVEKIRHGMPVAYPLPESMEIERGGKVEIFPLTEERQSRDQALVEGSHLPHFSDIRAPLFITAISDIGASGENLESTPPVLPSRRFMVPSQSSIPNGSITRELRPRSQTTQDNPPQRALSALAPSPASMRRSDLYGLLQQILSSGIPTEHEYATHTQPPPAYDSEEPGRV